MSLRIPYYPGCSQVGTSADYDQSVRAVAKVLGIELLDIEDWTCCGSTPAHTIDSKLSAALSARNLRQVKDAGGDSAVTPCPSCLANLKNAEKKIADKAMREKVNKLLDTPYEGGVTSKSFLQVVFEEIGSKGIADKVVKSLKGLTLAPYYGCLTTKPGGLMDFDDQENPISMDELMKAAGAKVPYFSFKTECCGASMAIPRNDAVTKLSGQIIGHGRTRRGRLYCRGLSLVPVESGPAEKPDRVGQQDQEPHSGLLLYPASWSGFRPFRGRTRHQETCCRSTARHRQDQRGLNRRHGVAQCE